MRGQNGWRLDYWGASCRPRLVQFVWRSGCSSWVDSRIVPALGYLDDILWAVGYQVRSCGSYNCRRITGGTIMSPHAWAIAVDINPAQNPYGRRLVTDIPLWVIEEVYRIRTASGQRVWKWGGDWDGDWDFDDHTVFDAMHFEMFATPAELAQGVRYDGTIDVEVTDHMFCSFGTKNDKVLAMQVMLISAGYDISFQQADGTTHKGDDGDFGSASLRGVERLQSNHGIVELDTTGKAKYGPRSYAALHAEIGGDVDLSKYATRRWVERQFVGWGDTPTLRREPT